MLTRARPIAFMCERTAEYALVPALAKILQRDYKAAFPFWFSSTREGSAVADLPASFRLLAAFARRPKVLVSGDRVVTVKFGHMLFEVARKARSFGIPVLAGVPLVSALEGLAHTPECWWFLIRDHSGNRDDVVHISSSLSGPARTGHSSLHWLRTSQEPEAPDSFSGTRDRCGSHGAGAGGQRAHEDR